MDWLQPLLPELARHISTAVVLQAAVPKCGDSHCSPVIHCSGDLTPQQITISGYSGYTLILTFIFGVIVGGSSIASWLLRSTRKPSAATIALKRLA